MKKITACALASTALLMLMSSKAQAETQSPWLVRAHLTQISPANKSDQVGGAGASDRLTVSDKTIPEFDVSYFFTPEISAELVLTYPQKHNVQLDGKDIGSFKHLPPTLSLQYHFLPGADINPYLGVGVNYTNISSVNLLNNTASLEHSSVGLALGAGVDFAIDKNWMVNVDVKKVQIGSDVSIGGAKVSNVKVDPWLIGVGIGYRF